MILRYFMSVVIFFELTGDILIWFELQYM